MAKRERLSLAINDEQFVRKGALVSYGADYRSMGVQSAKLVVKILQGAKPADLPVETPDRFVSAINLTTAKTSGLKISRTVLARADRLVE